MKKRKLITILIVTVLCVIVVVGVIANAVYRRIFEPNVLVGGGEPFYLYVADTGGFSALKDSLYVNNLVADKSAFEWVAQRKGLSSGVKSGRYEIVPNMSNNELVNLLRSGKQAPIKLTFNNIRTKEQFAGRMAEKFDFDSIELIDLLNDANFLKQYQKTPETAMSLFIPNTYLIYWNTTPENFIARMKKEYDAFWTGKRSDQAKEMKMTVDEVVTLASIVQEETNKNDEKPRVAGVYVNRLKSNWLLQADPTLKFALGDFTIRRVLDTHKEIESPYNTYKYTGLPPGPICMAEISSIDAVLNYERHNYYYFCAKDDMSGYHVFEASLAKHNINARKYRDALNRARIYR
ncbi:MAG: endolytic transglycosylase MltG [Bacteroidales bacterium]|nr:endolytic transglycosylase MltG [Bacteroidales bacterium]